MSNNNNFYLMDMGDGNGEIGRKGSIFSCKQQTLSSQFYALAVDAGIVRDRHINK